MTSFYFTQKDVERLEQQAVQIRQDIVSMIHAAKAGHPGGSLSAVEMVVARPGPVYPLQGPLLPGDVRRSGPPGVL